jgi:branched-chain amino acid transport system substrate-binding protein
MPRSQRPLLWRLLALLAVFSLFAAACGDDDDDTATDTTDAGTDTTAGGGEGKEVALAYVGPLTGDAANLGIFIRDGAKLAIEEANERQDDYEFVLKEFDTQGAEGQAATVKDQYINDDEIIGVVGPAFSGETKAVLPSLQEAGLVMVSASATNTDLPTLVPSDGVFHRIIPDDSFQGGALGDYIVEKYAGQTIVVIDDNTEYGKGLADDISKAITDGGQTVAKRITIDPDSDDFSAAVNDAKASNPGIIFYSGYYQEAGQLRKQLVDGGVTGAFLSGDGSLDVGFVEAAGAAAAEGAFIGCPCNLAAEADPTTGEFFTKYKDVIGKEPGIYSLEAYDAASILIEGILAGNDTRETLLRYIEEDFTSFEGQSKTVAFEENGNVKASDIYVFEVKGGKFVPAE